jgi:hypothetical protein
MLRYLQNCKFIYNLIMNTEIKKQLKTYDMKVSRLANDLGVSRPTLDSYIQYFENGQRLPSDKHNEIFNYLFSRKYDNPLDFHKSYAIVLEYLYKENSELIEQNIDQIKGITQEISTSPIDKPMLDYIQMLLKNRNNEIVKYIYNYFNYVNGTKQYIHENSSEVERALYSHLFKMFASIKKNSLVIDTENYDMFVKSNRLKFNKDSEENKLKEIIELIKEEIGRDEEIDIEKIREIVKKKGEE